MVIRSDAAGGKSDFLPCPLCELPLNALRMSSIKALESSAVEGLEFLSIIRGRLHVLAHVPYCRCRCTANDYHTTAWAMTTIAIDTSRTISFYRPHRPETRRCILKTSTVHIVAYFIYVNFVRQTAVIPARGPPRSGIKTLFVKLCSCARVCFHKPSFTSAIALTSLNNVSQIILLRQ